MHEDTGHPWKTRELYELRADQRAVLRDVDDWLIKESQLVDLPAIAYGSDRQMLELVIRRRAVTAIEAVPENFLRARAGRAAEAMEHDLFDQVSRGAMQRRWREPFWEAYENRPAATTAVADIPKDAASAICWATLLLAWAEELADDDYRDPRLAAAER